MLRTLVLSLIAAHLVAAQDVPFTRRAGINTQRFLDSAEAREVPASIPGDQSQVLVLLRLSERGSVLDSRASGGSISAQKAALEAVKHWRFKPSPLAGEPVHVHCAAVFDFSASPVSVRVPPPLNVGQISPVLSSRCSLANVGHAPDAVTTCTSVLRAVESNHGRTAMELFSALDDLAVALLHAGGKGKEALAVLDRATKLMPDGLTSSDGEWAKLHWHRAETYVQLGRRAEACEEYTATEDTLAAAAKLMSDRGVKIYGDLLDRVVGLHTKLLLDEGREDEAAAVRHKFAH